MLKKTKWLLVICIAVILSTFSGCTKKNGYVADKITVMGLDVGGKSHYDATVCLNALEMDKDKTVMVNADGVVFSITAGEAGAVYDSEKTADYLVEKSSGIFSGFLKKEYDPIVKIDEEMLGFAVSEKLKDYEREMVETTAVISNEGISVVNGISGKKIDREELGEKICRELAKDESNVIEISFLVTEVPPVDCNLLLSGFSGNFKDAEYIQDEYGNIIVTEEQVGVVIDKESAVAIMNQHTLEGESYVIPCTINMPVYTKAYLEECLFKDTLASYTTGFQSSGANRSSNISLAASSINQKVLMPGEVFSFNTTVGERTVDRGYLVAGAFADGQTVDQVGGGICQVSSTLYNAVLLSNLQIVERRSHQLVVGYVPLGRDATVDWGTTDFRFKNNTGFPVKIISEINGKKIKMSVIGTETIPNKEIKIETETVSVIEPETEYVTDNTMYENETKTEKGNKGYVIAATRVVYSNGEEIGRDKLTNSRYKATKTIVTVGTKAVEKPVITEETQQTNGDEYDMPQWLIPSN